MAFRDPQYPTADELYTLLTLTCLTREEAFALMDEVRRRWEALPEVDITPAPECDDGQG